MNYLFMSDEIPCMDAYFGGTVVLHHYSCNLSYHLFLWITGYRTEDVTE